MRVAAPTLWTADRINATINRQFVLDQLEPDEQTLVDRSLSFGDGLTDDTYLDWILTHAKRLFLILVEIGVPDQIFGLVDESYDDDDLPIAPELVPSLRLAAGPDKSLDKKFYDTQFRYIVKDLRAGEHVRFGLDETVPLEQISSRTGIPVLHKDDTDKVVLPGAVSKVYTRRKVVLRQPPHHLEEDDVLAEVSALTKYTHEHIVSIYASYAFGENIYVLMSPAPEYNLKSFLSDSPKAFEELPKGSRREILINWPHCLISALAWLHSRGRHHGAIRPSNIHIDSDFRIFFGQFDAFHYLHEQVKVDDIEAYQYAAPEKWKRTATAQSTGSAKTLGNSGGRSARRAPPAKKVAERRPSWSSEQPSEAAPIDTTKPTNTAVPFIPSSKSRIKLGDYRPSTSKTSKSSTGFDTASVISSESSGTKFSVPRSFSNKSSIPDLRPSKTMSTVPSIISSKSSGSGKVPANAPIPDPIAVPAAEVRTAIVQTWRSADHDPFPSDIFTFGAITLEIISFLCKRSSSSFARHRSAKNRTAGRGGGLADASFHANIGQLYSWIKTLDQDARKKAGKPFGEVYDAVKPMLEVILLCIGKEPASRPRAGVVEERLADCIWRHANISQLHCTNMIDKLDQMVIHDGLVSPDGSSSLGVHNPLVKTESHQSKMSSHSGRSAINGNENIAKTSKRKAMRDRLRLPSEPTIKTTDTGKPISSSNPYGYLGSETTSPIQQENYEPWEYHTTQQQAANVTSNGHLPTSHDMPAESYHAHTVDASLPQNGDNGEYQQDGFLLPDTRPTSSSNPPEGPPTLPLKRFSEFRIAFQPYADDAESLRTIETIRQHQHHEEENKYMEEHHHQEDDDDEPIVLNVGLRTPIQLYHPDDEEPINGHASNNGFDRADRHTSVLSTSTTASSARNPHFSWGWTNSPANSQRRKQSSNAEDMTSPRNASNENAGSPSMSSNGWAQNNRMSQASNSSRNGNNSNGMSRRNWPLATTEEEDEAPSNEPQFRSPPIHHKLMSPMQSPPILPFQSNSSRRSDATMESRFFDDDTEYSETSSGFNDPRSPSSMTSFSATSGSSGGTFLPKMSTGGLPKPEQPVHRSPVTKSGQSFYSNSSSSTNSSSTPPRKRNLPPQGPLPPVPSIPNSLPPSSTSEPPSQALPAVPDARSQNQRPRSSRSRGEDRPVSRSRSNSNSRTALKQASPRLPQSTNIPSTIAEVQARINNQKPHPLHPSGRFYNTTGLRREPSIASTHHDITSTMYDDIDFDTVMDLEATIPGLKGSSVSSPTEDMRSNSLRYDQETMNRMESGISPPSSTKGAPIGLAVGLQQEQQPHLSLLPQTTYNPHAPYSPDSPSHHQQAQHQYQTHPPASSHHYLPPQYQRQSNISDSRYSTNSNNSSALSMITTSAASNASVRSRTSTSTNGGLKPGSYHHNNIHNTMTNNNAGNFSRASVASSASSSGGGGGGGTGRWRRGPAGQFYWDASAQSTLIEE